MSQSVAALSKLGAWVAALRYDALPADVRRAARYQLLDMIAAAYAGAESTDTRSIASACAALGGHGGRSTVPALGIRLPPVEAAIANAAQSMANDFDDIVWMGHTCHSAVFATLAVAEHEDTGPREWITAIVAANEIGGRLGASSLLGPLNGQMWSFVHLVSAAAGVASLLRLDARETTHALAIALAQPNFALQPGFMVPSSKLLTASTPTATGMRSAYFARGGITGHPGILEDRRGFWRRFTFMPLAGMLDDLGTFWTTTTLGIKTHPGCYYFQTAFSALAEILARRPVRGVDDIARVSVATTKLACEATRFAAEYAGRSVSPVNVDFDLSLALAVMLHAGRFTPVEHEPGWLDANTQAIETWRARVDVRHDPMLTARVIGSMRASRAGARTIADISVRSAIDLIRRYRAEYRSTLVAPSELLGWVRALRGLRRRPGRPATASLTLAFPSRVEVHYRDGTIERAEHDVPRGAFGTPEAESALREKFMGVVGPRLGNARANIAFERGLALEAGSLSSFVSLCTSVHSA